MRNDVARIDLHDPGRPFRDWVQACRALRDAETLGADHIVGSAAAVIRSRNELTLDRVRAGWDPPDDVLRHLLIDDELLRHAHSSAPRLRDRAAI